MHEYATEAFLGKDKSGLVCPYCGCCPTYIKGGCKGCVDEHSEGDCYTRDCVLKQGIACCGACEQFPCDTIMTKPHTTVLDKDWLRWKKESNTNR